MIVSLLAVLPIASAAFIPHARHEHAEVVSTRFTTGAWHQPRDHFAHALFARGPGGSFPEVGSPEWSAGFPHSGPSDAVARIPADWKAALDTAVKAGKIPDIPPTKVEGDKGPVYPKGINAEDPKVCSSTVQCRLPGDIWDAPDGVFASSFDDGPLPPTTKLLEFLDKNNVTTTHFMIGSAILENVDQFKQVVASDNDLAVHTWSHRYTTSLSNEEVVGELGWTMQLIYNSTGGKLPRYWRPPYGDSDARVTAIANQVFGLTTVIWNEDSEDWTIEEPGGPTEAKVLSDVKGFIAAPSKSHGLVILEHELSDRTVDVFIKAFPDIAAKGWKFMSLADAYGGSDYQNDTSIVSLFGVPSSSTSSSPSVPATSSSSSSPIQTASQSNSQSASAQVHSSSSRFSSPRSVLCAVTFIFPILCS